MQKKSAWGYWSLRYPWWIIFSSALLCLSVVVFCISIAARLEAVDRRWQDDTKELAARSQLLQRLYSHFGSADIGQRLRAMEAGAGEQLPLLQSHLQQLDQTIVDYRRLSLQPSEAEALSQLAQSLARYRQRLAGLSAADEQRLAPRSAPSALSDSEGLAAIDTLAKIQLQTMAASQQQVSAMLESTMQLIYRGMGYIPVILLGCGLILYHANRSQRIQRDLREANLMKALTENMSEAILVSDQSGRIVSANDTACAVLGYELDEILTLYVDDLLPQRYRNRSQRGARGEPSGDALTGRELIALTKTGEEIDVVVSFGFTEQDGQRFSVSILLDISTYKKQRQLLQQQHDALAQQSLQDGLTAVGNRRFFDQIYPQEWSRALRSGQPLALLLIALDSLDSYNAQYGRDEGDRCLSAVASILRAQLQRAGDVVTRYSGARFACILPDTDRVSAMAIAERLRRAVVDADIAHARSAIARVVTISVGVSVAHSCRDLKAGALLDSADAALCYAQDLGCNQIRFVAPIH